MYIRFFIQFLTFRLTVIFHAGFKSTADRQARVQLNLEKPCRHDQIDNNLSIIV